VMNACILLNHHCNTCFVVLQGAIAAALLGTVLWQEPSAAQSTSQYWPGLLD
jgi:hypothetical protein